MLPNTHKIKLLHVFSAPESAYFFMVGQLQYMVARGIEVTVVLPFDEVFNSKFKQREPNVRIVNVELTRNISLVKDIRSLVKLIQVIRQVNPNIVQLHTPKASLLGGLAARILFKKNIIYQMHGLISMEGNAVNKGLMYHIEKLTCSLSTKIFAVSESLKNFAILNNYCDSAKISVIGNGTINGIDFLHKFNTDVIDKGNDPLKQLSSEKFIIGFVGRLLKDKGIEDYIKVLAEFKKREIPFMGFVVGPDESGNDFINLLEQNNIIVDKDIVLFGQQLYPEEFMVYFDILLLPTRREGFGLVGAEANALEIPVVGYDIPGFRDAVINNETGTLVEYGNINKLLDAVINYYNNQSLIIEHGKNGRERVMRNFKSEDIWNHLYQEYQSLALG